MAQIISGASGVIVRIHRNYQRNIFGNKNLKNKKLDKTKTPKHAVLENLVD